MLDPHSSGDESRRMGNPVRGILIGIPLSLGLWAIIFALWAWLS
jgi:hypothetical protein